MRNIGDRLKQARKDKRLRQVQVKELTGINNKTLSGYENGVSEPDYKTLKILSDLYGVSVNKLISGVGESELLVNGELIDFNNPDQTQQFKEAMIEMWPKERIVGTPEYEAEITNFLERSDITYNAQKISPEDRDRIQQMLKLIMERQ